MMNMKRLLSLLLALVMVLGMIPAPAFATEGEEDTSVDVVLSLSADECFMVGPGSGAIMAMKNITVPYFDLALYGLEEYYFVSESYGDDGDGLPGSDLEPGTAEYAYGKVTLLHLYLYALEVFYCGIDPEEAGKGYLYEEGLIGTEVFNISGGVGSSFMNQFWGGDCNLNYYVNYEYPLASGGWGATCDQILLRDGDIITLGHFTGWSFYGDTYSIFNYITANNSAPVKGEEITLTLYYAGSNLGFTDGTAQNLNPYCLDVYYAPVDDIPSEYVTDWEYLGTSDENGELVVDTSELETGEYIFAVAGQYGVDYPDDICSTPGGVRITVAEPAHDHSYEAAVTAPTCTEAGFTTYTCDCGDSYVDDEVPALGHDYVEGICTRCDATRVNPFTDVPEDSWYINYVLWAVENGITSGTGENVFSPDGNVTRAQVVTFLWAAANKPEPITTINPFVDVVESDYFYKAVLWAVENGITGGTSAATFSPAGITNRAQVVTFLWKYMGQPEPGEENPFSDVDAAAWYGKPVLWAAQNGITSGMSPTEFGVGSSCVRAHMVTFLYSAMN